MIKFKEEFTTYRGAEYRKRSFAKGETVVMSVEDEAALVKKGKASKVKEKTEDADKGEGDK